MNVRNPLVSALLAALFIHAGLAQALSIEPLATYATGLAQAGSVTSGETAALRGNKLYVTNAEDVSVDIVDVSAPLQPRLHKRVHLGQYGGGITSVDVSSKNLVAVALHAPKKTEPGTVVFMTPAGQVIRTATVGALPDMVVFTPDGTRLLVAN